MAVKDDSGGDGCRMLAFAVSVVVVLKVEVMVSYTRSN